MNSAGLDRSFAEHPSEFALHEPHRCASGARPASELAARVYQYALGGSPVGPNEVARTLGCSPGEAIEAIATLRELRLVRHPNDRDDRFVSVCPEVAQAEVLLPLEESIHHQRSRLTELRQRLTPMIEAFDEHRISEQTQTVVVPESADEGRLRLTNAVREVRGELCVVKTPDHDDADAADGHLLPLITEALGRGVAVRVVYGHTARTNPRTRERAAEIQAHGGQVRTVDSPYSDMIVVDQENAFVPCRTGVVADHSTALCREPNLVGLFSGMFDRMWSSATDFQPQLNAYGHTLDDLRRTILQLLAAGLTDEALARRLGLSPRTCRRHIAAIMDTLQASSRFEAGVKVSMSGLLPATGLETALD